MEHLFWIGFVGFVVAGLFAIMQAKKVMSYSEGTERMQKLAAAIREGANAYLKQQYKTVFKVFVVVFVVLLAIAFGSDGDVEKEIERVKKFVDLGAILGVKRMRHDATVGYAWNSGNYVAFETLLPRLADACRKVTEYAEQFGISRKKLDTTSVHVHVPEGATPKDGPSAGITMTTAMVSAFTGKKVRERIAMTGEMTLRGKVLPIGGVKEKLLAAKRAGIVDIILCEKNRKDVDDIPAKYLKGLRFHYVQDIQEVIDFAIVK